ncbi:MAG: alkaline shock response membrane anchor protein AmaP [Candidatus Omnitrophica bacterium]|nr:alkaline shock response membrane anchor protein AmaP [Candidatus Omnitrophota bacterium]MBU4473433.1 alkaline shock response membrane anchor protein AmaP [Candidatus Omnitrophota bacterium]MCG2706232.1 alkaline shock response membrane anchor protein AmaP [Candidatus Omnitrophota bacterium]
MKIFIVLGIVFYALVLILIGVVFIVFSLNLLQPQDINNLLAYLQYSPNSRIIIGLSGLLLILISFSFAQLILGRFQRERTIAFTTSSGEVTIALSAIEDLIKRLGVNLPEIKELRPDVIATKKGIIVDLRVILRSESNIPELTARLQEIARSKIQEVLGLEEQIIIKIHVTKIILAEEKERKKKESEKEEPTIPFSSYGKI